MAVKLEGPTTTVGTATGTISSMATQGLKVSDEIAVWTRANKVYASGRWTKAEEQELTEVINDLRIKHGKVSDVNWDIPWAEASVRMGGRRGRQQCSAKW